MKLDVVIHRWDNMPLEKVTEMVSRKVLTGHHQVLAQVYLKRGAQVPLHTHTNEQMVYVLQGVLQCRVGGRDVAIYEGEVLHVPAGVPHQAEAIEDTFQLVVYAQIREDSMTGNNTTVG